MERRQGPASEVSVLSISSTGCHEDSCSFGENHSIWIRLRKLHDGFQVINGSKIGKEKVKPGPWVPEQKGICTHLYL